MTVTVTPPFTALCGMLSLGWLVAADSEEAATAAAMATTRAPRRIIGL